MERYNRRRSGYEPSDTETEWNENPRRDNNKQSEQTFDGKSPLPSRRPQSISPYRPREDEGNDIDLEPFNSDMQRNLSPFPRRNISPFAASERRSIGNNKTTDNACAFSHSERRLGNNSVEKNRGNMSPFSASERRRYVSPYRISSNEGYDMSHGRSNSRRAKTAPRSRMRSSGNNKQMNYDQYIIERGGAISSQNKGPSIGEINEMVAHAKISKGFNNGDFESIDDSISHGDIFFSKVKEAPRKLLPKPPGYVERNNNNNNSNNVRGSHQINKVKTVFNNIREISQATMNSSSGLSKQGSSNTMNSNVSSRTSASTRNFVANRQKSQQQSDHAWFSCIRKGSCRTSQKSPEKDRPFDESLFIEKATIVESLRPLWADKHQPALLSGFICHKQEALFLQQLAANENLPHIVLKGPSGSGKKALTMALLREVFGDPVWNVSHDLRYFHILESRPIQVAVHVSSSPHHVELNVYSEPKATYALTALVKQINSEFAVTPEISTAHTKADYKVMVLYDVDKAAESIQHLIKWIMDCYSDYCKLVLCCEDDADILESVKSRCKTVNVEAPPTNEVVEVLMQIAKREGFELSTTFAAKIANKSKQNLRRAIMALEACKAHNYPFAEDQPIPLGWEDAVIEFAAHILADPSQKRLLTVRGKIQKLLCDFVHPKLILLKLVEQFLRGVDVGLKREIYYWYAYYDKRLPSGTSALLKLEEFVAKFMSIYRKKSAFNRPLS